MRLENEDETVGCCQMHVRIDYVISLELGFHQRESSAARDLSGCPCPWYLRAEQADSSQMLPEISWVCATADRPCSRVGEQRAASARLQRKISNSCSAQGGAPDVWDAHDNHWDLTQLRPTLCHSLHPALPCIWISFQKQLHYI